MAQPIHRSTRLAMAALLGLSGCNLITGADEIGLVTGAGWPEAGTGPAGLPGTWVAADGVSIDEVAIYQGVKRPLMQAGAAVDAGVPLVAGRNALLRLFVTTTPGFEGRPVTALLGLGAQQPLAVTLSLPANSSEDDLGSTLNIEIPGPALAPATEYRVDLVQAPELSSGQNEAAHYPGLSGSSALPVEGTPVALRIVLVPIVYEADGSGRVPDTSEEQLRRFRETLYALYPVSSVELRLGAPITWTSPLGASGSGWEDILDSMTLYRDEGVDAEEYAYGLVAPAESLELYCVDGCVAGLSTVAGPNDVFARAGVGIGFGGQQAADTAAHEIGHMHGRQHAPCGPGGSIDGIDAGYPYAGGLVGATGYDLVSRSLRAASAHFDLMGYCAPSWISDYTYAALLERIRWVSGLAANIEPPVQGNAAPLERISVHADGSTRWLGSVARLALLEGEAVPVDVLVGDEWVVVEGQWLERSALGGGLLLVARSGAAAQAARFSVGGVQRTVTRD